MSNIDVAIPLLAGIVFIAIPDKLVKPSDPNFEKKTNLIKKCGYVLVGVAVIFFLVKRFA